MTENMQNTNPIETAVPASNCREITYTVEYILGRLEAITEQGDYVYPILDELSRIESRGPGDIGAEAKAHALGNIVQCRETTTQQMIRLYEKMYEHLTLS